MLQSQNADELLGSEKCRIILTWFASGAWLYQNVSDVSKLVSDALMTIGWVIMIPSQSVVLWSRLHLITHNKKLLRALLFLIIADSVVFIIPTCVFNWGALLQREQPYLRGYTIIEKIQMCVFSAQEILISGVYLFEVYKVMGNVRDKRSRGMVRQLTLMNVLIISLDIIMLSVEFCNWFMIQVTLKGLVYSVKLKVEFAVLSKIINLVRDKRSESQRAVDEAAAAAALKIQPLASPAILLQDPEKAVAFPQVSAASTTRTNSSEHLAEQRVRSMESARLSSCGGSIVHNMQFPDTILQAGVLDEDESRYMRSLQQNVPADWRLSIGHEALSGPNLYEIRQLSYGGHGPDEDAIESLRDMYPGRLG